ncbi:MAG TPA: ABC transporter ATP-binding protein [Chloroflexota bacterium]
MAVVGSAVPRLRLRQASVAFDVGDQRIQAFEGVDLDVYPGEILCVVGPSGCGKSTLLHALAGLQPLTEGLVELDGQPLPGPDPRCGVIFQDAALFPWLSVADNVRFGPSVLGRTNDLDVRVDRLLDLVGLRGFAHLRPSQLSGGMAQRVALARALANEPEVLLLDEPFAALDFFTRLDLQEELLRVVAVDNLTVVFVTHDIDEALYLGDRIVVLTGRPGHVRAVHRVDLPRPRQRYDEALDPLRRAVLSDIAVGRRPA